ncbi:MAG: hypothetical protein PHN79_06825, partial [Methanoregula sp.]|nr:hypothetical protein [Methanoregula sp.]
HDTFVVGKVPAGVHTVFSRYRELGVDELYSESRTFRVTPVGTTTTIHVEMIDGGTGIICTGNITAQGRGISGAPLELVWDDTHVITIQADAAGTYRQQVTLPVGAHRIYANFSAQDYPVTASRSNTVTVTIVPPIDLYVRPSSVQYMDQLTIGGALRGANTSAKDVQIVLDGRKLGTYRTDAKGNYSTMFSVETIPAGVHRVYASSGAHTSGTEAFTVVPVNASLVMSARLSPDGTQVVCSGQLRAGENLPVRSAPVTIAWGGTNTTTTTTDLRGEFEETLSLPAGGYDLVAQFDKTDLYPIEPARSAVVHIQVPNPITVRVIPESGKYRDTLAITVQPDHGRYRDTLLVNGSLHADQIAYQEIRLFVDDRLTGTYRTDAKGAFTTPYTIEKITGGRHTLKAVRGAITSTAIPFVVLMDSTTTTLSAERTGSTAEVTISGRVNTTNRTVRDATVTITWDGTHSLETRTDGNGVFRDSIILPAGTHRILARFNRTDLYPLHPSNRTTVMINISPGLSLDVKPSSGTYKNPLTLQGTLVRPGSLDGTVNLFLDNQQIATTTTDRAGHYSHTLIIEQLPAGSHTVQVKTGDLASGVKTFTVLPAHSRTTLTVTPVNTSTLTTCNGTVMAFNRAGDVIRRPGNIRDVIALLPTLGRDPWSAATRPVGGAPVALIVNNERLLEMQTDAYGRFSCVVALLPGDNRITARFDATGFPLYPSQAKEHSVNIPSANMTPFVEEESNPVTALVPVLVVVAILLLFTGGAVFYLKRRSLRFMTRRTTAETSVEDEARASAAEIEQEIVAAESYLAAVSPPDPAQVATDPLLARYIRILNAQGLSTAARAVYVHFTGSIAERLHIRRHRTLTPREFLGQCDKRSFTDTFSAFIAVYEQVRYGGIKTPAKENEFEESVKKTDESLGGDKD